MRVTTLSRGWHARQLVLGGGGVGGGGRGVAGHVLRRLVLLLRALRSHLRGAVHALLHLEAQVRQA